MYSISYAILILIINYTYMGKSKIGNIIKVVGVLTFVGTLLAKIIPMLKEENPKLKKKIGHIGDLLSELKDEIIEVGAEVQKKRK